MIRYWAGNKGLSILAAAAATAAIPAVIGAGGHGAAAPPELVAPGRLVVWGSDLLQPSGEFVGLAAGGSLQTLAIKWGGTLYIGDADPSPPGVSNPPTPIPEIPSSLSAVPFAAVGLGRQHALAIRSSDGGIEGWPTPSPADGAPAGHFVAVSGTGQYSVALDVNGQIAMWGTLPPGVSAPTGRTFEAIASRLRYTLALGTDGNIYGWGTDMGIFTSKTDPWAPDGSGHFVAPSVPGNPYTAIAAGIGPMPYGLIVALRQDGSIMAWDPSGTMASPPAGVFKRIAAGLGYAVAIDEAGRLHAWTDPDHTAFANVPAGFYSDVSAATTHASAIAVPATTAIGRADMWIGLKNSDDVGTKFDLLAEVLRNGEVVANSELDGIAGGSSGFNNAVLRQIGDATASAPICGPGDTLALRLSVRIAANVTGHRSGTARLWYGDGSANSRLETIVNGVPQSFYLAAGSALSPTAPAGPRSTSDVTVDRAVGGNPFKPFGTWSVELQ